MQAVSTAGDTCVPVASPSASLGFYFLSYRIERMVISPKTRETVTDMDDLHRASQVCPVGSATARSQRKRLAQS